MWLLLWAKTIFWPCGGNCHMYSELEFELPKTLALIRRELETMDIPHTESYGKSSIVAFLNPERKVKIPVKISI